MPPPAAAAAGVVKVSPGEETAPSSNSRGFFFPTHPECLAQDLQPRGWPCGEAVVLPAGLSRGSNEFSGGGGAAAAFLKNVQM